MDPDDSGHISFSMFRQGVESFIAGIYMYAYIIWLSSDRFFGIVGGCGLVRPCDIGGGILLRDSNFIHVQLTIILLARVSSLITVFT